MLSPNEPKIRKQRQEWKALRHVKHLWQSFCNVCIKFQPCHIIKPSRFQSHKNMILEDSGVHGFRPQRRYIVSDPQITTANPLGQQTQERNSTYNIKKKYYGIINLQGSVGVQKPFSIITINGCDPQRNWCRMKTAVLTGNDKISHRTQIA